MDNETVVWVGGSILLVLLILVPIIIYGRKRTKERIEAVKSGKNVLVHWTFDQQINLRDFQSGLMKLTGKKLSAAKEVWICPDCILVGEVFFSLGKDTELIITENPSCLFFKIYSGGSEETSQLHELRIPIPQGKVTEAKYVEEAFQQRP